MSLNYDLTKVPRENWDSDDIWLMAQNMIFLTMSVGLGEITEENLVEFTARANFVEHLFGNLGINRKALTIDDIRPYIGLKTNVSNEDRKKWMIRQSDNFLKSTIYRIQRKEEM